MSDGKVHPRESGVEPRTEKVLQFGRGRIVLSNQVSHTFLQVGLGLVVCHAVVPRCFPSSLRASAFLWTSSGPSAKRRVRIPANHSASGKSWLRPLAPWTWIALSTIHST